MAVEGSEEIFNKWLTKKLKGLDVEDEVLASYISSIVTTDDVDTDKMDVLKDIFQDLMRGVDTEALCSEILEEWTDCHDKALDAQVIEQTLDLGERVSLIVGRSVQPVLRSANRSEEEEKIREAILSRCNYVSEDEEDCESDEGAASSSHAPAQNQNAEAVAAAERAKREKLKCDSQEKKAQDRVNKDKQKAKQEERREKERKRTQKGERRR